MLCFPNTYRMLVVFFTMLQFLSLQNVTTSSVYTVIPDDHYYLNTTCYHCHNLQYYLLNATKYFTSNTQLLFLTGLHHLHTDLIIQNVQNISLIGNTTTNGGPGVIPDVAIKCKYNKGIVFVNVTNLKVTSMEIKYCVSQYHIDATSEIYGGGAVMIMRCTAVVLYWLHIHALKDHSPVITSLMTVNILGNSYFSHITCYGAVYLFYNDTSEEVNKSFLVIHHYCQKIYNYALLYPLMLHVYKTSYMIILQLEDIKAFKEECKQCRFYFHVVNGSAINLTSVFFENCHFGNYREATLLHFKNSRVWFKNCQFLNNTRSEALITMTNTVASFSHCFFSNNSNTKILQVEFGSIRLNNVEFSYNSNFRKKLDVLDLLNAVLLLESKVVFKNNIVSRSVIAARASSLIKVLNNGIIEFSKNVVLDIISFSCNKSGEFIQLTEKCKITFVGNQVCAIFNVTLLSYPLCIFQYYGIAHHQQLHRNYSVALLNNRYFINKQCFRYMPIADCRWLPDSLFTNILPVDINNRYITYISNFNTNHSEMMPQRYDLCLCKGKGHPDCSISKLGYFYPGQTLQLNIYHKSSKQNCTKVKITHDSDVEQLYISPCMVGAGELLQAVEDNSCTTINYTLGYPTNDKCGLFLKPVLDSNDHIRLLYVEQFLCPSYLNLTTPDAQCQFNRSGILCGHCQQGLSVMFASSRCQHCSSIHLLLIVPIAIAGILLVLILFILNLTVTDGTINVLLLYVNLAGINSTALFQTFTPVYTFTSLANLDLGIQTCFYDGMDDYAKMWLQLAFPFYLIFIATSLIITSRYSSTIQRLTARRALPVLATLFLLSYAKILHTGNSLH